ncbi:MAG: hypothetical protein Q7T61_01150 [Caulobacter sp.]|nr:hypothetical protein [Caulobacter sp.]
MVDTHTPVIRTPKGYPIWRGLAVDQADLPSLRSSVASWANLEPYDPSIKRDNDHTRAVIRALEE